MGVKVFLAYIVSPVLRNRWITEIKERDTYIAASIKSLDNE